MANDGAISVIIPLYNKRDTFARAVESCLAQTHPPLDIIVIDDGSTDGSVESLPASLRQAITLKSQPNRGVSAARNAGVEAARGDLLAFLDADDELLPSALAIYTEMGQDYPDAGFYSGSIERISEGGKPFLPSGAWSTNRTGIVESFEHEYRRNRALLSSSSVCIRRDTFLVAGGFPVGEKLGEDVYLWLQLARISPLCHTGRLVSRIHRDAPNRAITTSAGSDQTPFYLRYFLQTSAGLERYRANRSLRRLLFTLSLRTLLGAKQNGADVLVQNTVSAFRSASPVAGALLALAARMPVGMIARLRAR